MGVGGMVIPVPLVNLFFVRWHCSVVEMYNTRYQVCNDIILYSEYYIGLYQVQCRPVMRQTRTYVVYCNNSIYLSKP